MINGHSMDKQPERYVKKYQNQMKEKWPTVIFMATAPTFFFHWCPDYMCLGMLLKDGPKVLLFKYLNSTATSPNNFHHFPPVKPLPVSLIP